MIHARAGYHWRQMSRIHASLCGTSRNRTGRIDLTPPVSRIVNRTFCSKPDEPKPEWEALF